MMQSNHSHNGSIYPFHLGQDENLSRVELITGKKNQIGNLEALKLTTTMEKPCYLGVIFRLGPSHYSKNLGLKNPS